MSCKRCNGKGFLEYETHRNAKFFVQLYQCCDIEKYSAEVKRRHAMPPEEQEPKLRRFWLIKGDLADDALPPQEAP